jgi:hypothetical protein
MPDKHSYILFDIIITLIISSSQMYIHENKITGYILTYCKTTNRDNNVK